MKGAGRSIREIARELDVSRNTVRRDLTCIWVQNITGYPVSARCLRLAGEQADKSPDGETSITATTSDDGHSGPAPVSVAGPDLIRRAPEGALPAVSAAHRRGPERCSKALIMRVVVELFRCSPGPEGHVRVEPPRCTLTGSPSMCSS